VNIIRQRVDAAGVGGASINTQGSTNIVVSAPGVSRSTLASLDETALLRFRQVLAVANGVPAPAPSASAATPTPSASAAVKKSPAAKKKKSSHDAAADYIVSCSKDATQKFLLAPADVEGSEIHSADATVNTQTNEWLVQLNFSHKGATDWYN